MSRLIIGFDSAWTPQNSGALVGCLLQGGGSIADLGEPVMADFTAASTVIQEWQATHQPASTLILIDQPTIVTNQTGQRAVENIISSIISRRRGGMQPSNREKLDMFGDHAPIWPFLEAFGGAIDPAAIANVSGVIETYPTLALVALGAVITIPGNRPRASLPKYNPERTPMFRIDDWILVCNTTADALARLGATAASDWARNAATVARPTKAAQDKLDACLCLVVALHLALGQACLHIGNHTGFLVVPHGDLLLRELRARCAATGRVPDDWVRRLN